MTLQLIHSEFPYTVYEENSIFFFISELQDTARESVTTLYKEVGKLREKQSADRRSEDVRRTSKLQKSREYLREAYESAGGFIIEACERWVAAWGVCCALALMLL